MPSIQVTVIYPVTFNIDITDDEEYEIVENQNEDIIEDIKNRIIEQAEKERIQDVLEDPIIHDSELKELID